MESSERLGEVATQLTVGLEKALGEDGLGVRHSEYVRWAWHTHQRMQIEASVQIASLLSWRRIQLAFLSKSHCSETAL